MKSFILKSFIITALTVSVYATELTSFHSENEQLESSHHQRTLLSDYQNNELPTIFCYPATDLKERTHFLANPAEDTDTETDTETETEIEEKFINRISSLSETQDLGGNDAATTYQQIINSSIPKKSVISICLQQPHRANLTVRYFNKKTNLAIQNKHLRRKIKTLKKQLSLANKRNNTKMIKLLTKQSKITSS